MILKIAEIVAGLALALLTLRDVFGTVVAPGPTGGGLRMSRRIVRSTLFTQRRIPGRHRLWQGFGPLMLLAAFVSWLLLMVLAFGLIALGLGDEFDPAVRDFGQALYTGGSAVATLGLSGVKASGAARWLVLIAAGCGMSVMTMAVTYVLQVQTGLHQREAGVLKLATNLSEPLSGLEILETYGRLGCAPELTDLFREWREWSASVLQTHSSHPALVYFRSVTGQGDWTAALGAVLDAAAITVVLLDERSAAVAILCHRDGARFATQLGELFGLKPKPTHGPSPESLERLQGRLTAAGFRLKPAPKAAARLEALRRDYAGWLATLAEHVGLDGPALEL